MFGLNIIENLNLNSFYGAHGVYQLYTLIGFSICILEIRYITQKLPAPRLTWFYQAYTEHEYTQLILNLQDRAEELSRKFLAVSKEQIDYYLIHKEFVYIKKRSLSVFLENEKKNLEKHFYDRTINMLKTIENMENSNIRNKIKEVTEESLKTVLNKLNDPNTKKQIQQASFQSALDGLRTGKMTYKGDILLPMFINEIKARLEPIAKLSKEEENRIFALSEYQKNLLIENDNRAKIEYLVQPPDVASAGVKNTDVYKNIIGRMKRR